MDRRVIKNAAGWYAQLCSGDCGEAERAAFEAWRRAHADHEQAWRQVEALRGRFLGLPREISVNTLRMAEQPDLQRRAVLRGFAGVGLASGTAWMAGTRLPWGEWTAGQRTAIGEQREICLADGSRLLLNTASAVDVRFDETQRLVRLYAGELLIETALDPAPIDRPFMVQTPHGRLRSLDARFAVRSEAESTRLLVLDRAVEVLAQGRDQPFTLQASAQLSFSRDHIGASKRAADANVAWTHGQLIVDDWTLAEVIAELGRYQTAALICDEAVSRLRVSGAFPLRRLEQALAALTQTLPIALTRSTRWTGRAVLHIGAKTA